MNERKERVYKCRLLPDGDWAEIKATTSTLFSGCICAGENYAAQIWNAGDDTSLDFEVEDETGDRYNVTVDVEFEPSYDGYGYKQKTKPATP